MSSAAVGEILKSWRAQRRLSQLDLAVEAEISQRHLSFIESGRATPSRDMVLHLAEHLEVPLRDRNALLLAAGFAPVFQDRPINDPALSQAKASIDRLLKAHEPYPALTFDRHWNIVSANEPVWSLVSGVDPDLLTPPVNVLRLSLHPAGLAPRIANLAEWRRHLLDRLRRQLAIVRDPTLGALLREVKGYPDDAGMPSPDSQQPGFQDQVAIPLSLKTPGGMLSFLSTVTVFGTALEITLSELTLEAFYPADEATATAMRS